MSQRMAGLVLVLCGWQAVLLGQNPPLRIANDSFPDAVLGQEYLQALRYSGGCQSDLSPKPGFIVAAGALPDGLAIETPSNAGSNLTGVPTAAGAFHFTLKVADVCGSSATKEFSITVVRAVAAAPSILPQFVFGGGWHSALYFTNTSSGAVSFPISFVADNGQPLVVPALGGSAVTMDLRAHGAAIIEAPNTGPLVQGYVSVVLPFGVVGYGVLQSSTAGQPDQEAVAPLTTPSTASTLIWDDTQFVTAIAVVNAGSSDDLLTIVARDRDGATVGAATIPMAARSKVAVPLKDFPGLAALAGNFGSAEFTMASGSLAVLGLRFHNGAFTYIPVARAAALADRTVATVELSGDRQGLCAERLSRTI